MNWPAPEGDRRKRIAFGLFALALVVFHVVLTNHFVSFGRALSARPFTGDDFDTHIAQTYRVIEGLERFGHSWVYDVKLLAGQPEGTIFDADNKGWELWTYALYRLGVPKGTAFNLFVLLAHLACPLVMYRAARLFELRPMTGLLAGFLASLFWFFDSFTHWAWWIGMVAYAAAGFFALWPLGAFYRFTRERKPRQAVATGLLLGAAHLLHPYSFFVLGPGMATLYLGNARSFTRRDHLAVVGIVLCTLAMNAYWLHAAFIHWHYILDSAYFGQTGLPYLVADFFGILLNPSDSGVIGTRAGFRFLCIALSVAGLIAWRKQRDPRFAVFAVVIGSTFALSYFAAYLPHAGQIQPYRHIIPLGFCAALAGAAFLEQLMTSRALRNLAPPGVAVLAVTSLIAFEQLGRDALYFLPELVPNVSALIDGGPSPVSEYGYGHFGDDSTHFSYRMPRGPLYEVGERKLQVWIERNIPDGERVLVDNPSFGERLAWRSRVEVLGGFRERNLAHAYANFFRLHPKLTTDLVVGQYIATYAVSWVILHAPRPDLEKASWLTRTATVAGRRIYRVKVATSKVLRGGGRVRASTNRIEVFGSEPTSDLVLSYHFHEALRCTPDCKLEREKVAGNRVGFIRVPAPHAKDIVIWNAYEM